MDGLEVPHGLETSIWSTWWMVIQQGFSVWLKQEKFDRVFFAMIVDVACESDGSRICRVAKHNDEPWLCTICVKKDWSNDVKWRFILGLARVLGILGTALIQLVELRIPIITWIVILRWLSRHRCHRWDFQSFPIISIICHWKNQNQSLDLCKGSHCF